MIFTDPPYTAEGIGVFISKANQMIKKNAFSSLLICYKSAEQSNGLGIQVQRVINRVCIFVNL